MTYMTGHSQGGPRDWELGVEGIRALLESALNATAGPLGIWDANGLEALLLATEPGQVVAGGALTREEWWMYRVLFGWLIEQIQSAELAVYLDQDGQPVTMTPAQIARYRRMPAPEPPQPLGGAMEPGPDGVVPPPPPGPLAGPGGLSAPLVSRLRPSAPGKGASPDTRPRRRKAE